MPRLITSSTLASATSSFSFSAIPSTSTDLLIVGTIRTSGAATNDQIRIKFNEITTGDYSFNFLRGSGSSISVQMADNQTSGLVGLMNGNTTTANAFASFRIYIPSYLSTNKKPSSAFTVMEDNATTAFTTILAGFLDTTAAITSITFTSANSYNFMVGSSFYLYGIKNS